MRLRNAADAFGERSGEKCRLAFGREFREDRFQFVGKAHVEHFVGFVHDERLDGGKIERSLFDVVKCASRGGYDDVYAAVQKSDLASVFLSAVDGGNDDSCFFAEVIKGFGNLQTEFTGRGQNENGRQPFFLLHDIFFNEGERKGGGFPRPRRGLSQHVFSGEEHGDRRGLNGRRFFKAHLGEGTRNGVGKSESGKGVIHGKSPKIRFKKEPRTASRA